MQRIARPGERRDVIRLDSLDFGDGFDEVRRLAERLVTPAKRRDLNERFKSFFARSERIFVGADPRCVRIERAPRAIAQRTPLSLLSHRIFVVERQV